jgi:TolB-like protein
MGRLLGLDVIVEGTAQQFGSHVRIALRMSDVHSGKLIWAKNYDCPAGDPASAESSVARGAAEQIGQRLSH